MNLDIENVFVGFIQELLYYRFISLFPHIIAVAFSIFLISWIGFAFYFQSPYQKRLTISSIYGYIAGYIFMRVREEGYGRI